MTSKPSSGKNSVLEEKNRAGSSQIAPPLSQPAKGLGLTNEKSAPKEYLDITSGRHRPFMIASSVMLFVSHIPILLIFILYMIKKDQTNSYLFSFFQGSPNLYFGYAITATVLLFAILIAPSITPLAGRKGFQFPLYLLYLVCMFYLVVFSFMRQSQGIYKYNWDNIMLFIGCAIYNASFGAIITSAFSVRKVPKEIAIAIAVLGELMDILLIWLFAAVSLRPLWEWLLYLSLAAALAAYYTYDLEMMVRKRGQFYRTSDWFLGFVHLQTDLFYRLPVDLLSKKNSDAENVTTELQVTEPEITN